MSDNLRASIDSAVKAIHANKRGQATAAVTLEGVQFEVGHRVKPWLTLGGYAGRPWRGGWEAGAKATATW